MQNIGAANADDAFYRYKMPKLQAKVCRRIKCAAATYGSRVAWERAVEAPALFGWLQIEGRGNGIKTNVVNNVEIAKALERPPECKPPLRRSVLSGQLRASLPPGSQQLGGLELTQLWCSHTDVLKYYGCELGAQTNFDKASGTSIVNGAHDTRKLSELLEVFIKKYVCCYSCNNPETQIKIKKENIYLKVGAGRGQTKLCAGRRGVLHACFFHVPASPPVALRPAYKGVLPQPAIWLLCALRVAVLVSAGAPQCKACGFVSDVDPRHKLNTFILKNPPENKLKKEEQKWVTGASFKG